MTKKIIKVRPILMSTPMVQAVFENRKKLTRRIMNKSLGILTVNDNPDYWKLTIDAYPGAIDDEDYFSYADFYTNDEEWSSCMKCPYGRIDDILWVRESFSYPIFFDGTEKDVYYKADEEDISKERHISGKWKPSIHMPYSACRLWLKITDIKVERLHDINKEDAMNEGYDPLYLPFGELDPLAWFRYLWSQINGHDSWNNNPWVWVISFKKINKPANI